MFVLMHSLSNYLLVNSEAKPCKHSQIPKPPNQGTEAVTITQGATHPTPANQNYQVDSKIKEEGHEEKVINNL